MRVRLDSLLECPHFLNFHQLSAPLLVNSAALISLNLQFIQESFFLLFELLDFFLELLNFLISLFSLFTLESIDCLQKAVWIFHFMLDKRPQLFEESTQVFRFFLGLLQFLIEKLLAVTE